MYFEIILYVFNAPMDLVHCHRCVRTPPLYTMQHICLKLAIR